VAGIVAEPMDSGKGACVMFNDRMRQQMSVRTAIGIGLLAAMAVGVGACGTGATHASTSAAPMIPASQSVVASEPAAPSAVAPTAVASAAPQTPAAVAAPPKSVATVKPATGNNATTAPKATSPAPTVTTAPAKSAPTLPARRQPTPAEVNQVIASVHALVPLFTPTSAQVATVGNQVCTAFDQGKTLAQVKATAMQMAGAYAALIPDSVATSAVRTVVTMFCPGYTSKLV
jgi:hypothetical protein